MKTDNAVVSVELKNSTSQQTDPLFNLRNVFSNKQNPGCDVITMTKNEIKSSSLVALRKEESKHKFDASTVSKAEKSSKIDAAEDDKSNEAAKENKRDGPRREQKRSRHHSKREDLRRQKDENKKSKMERERLQSANNVVLHEVAVEPKPERVVHNDLFSDSDDDDTPKYDVYSLARLFQGQITENFRALNSQILDPVADTEEADNELYCLCRYESKT